MKRNLISSLVFILFIFSNFYFLKCVKIKRINYFVLKDKKSRDSDIRFLKWNKKNDEILLAIGFDYKIEIWNVTNKKIVYKIEPSGEENEKSEFVFLSWYAGTNNQLITFDSFSRLKIWNYDFHVFDFHVEEMLNHSLHLIKVKNILLHPSENLFCSYSLNRNIMVWSIKNIKNNMMIKLIYLIKQRRDVMSMAWNCNNQDLFATVFNDGSIGIFNYKNGKCVKMLIDCYYKNHFEFIDINWNYKNKDVLAVSYLDGNIEIWNCENGECFNSFMHSNSKKNNIGRTHVSWNPKYEHVIATFCENENCVKIWNTYNDKVQILTKLEKLEGNVRCLSWNVDKPWLLCIGLNNGSVLVFEIKFVR